MKKTILIGIVILALFLTGCSSMTENGLTTNYRKGTQGVELNFIKNMPGDYVYFERGITNTIANLGVMVSNKGATDSDEIYLVIHGYDPNMLEVNSRDIRGHGSFGTNLIERMYLQGKSIFNPIGEYEAIFFDISMKSDVPGSFNEFETPFIATICYDYETIFEQDICIDTDVLNQETAGKKACSLSDNREYVSVMPWDYVPQQQADTTAISYLLTGGSGSNSGGVNYLTDVGQGAPVVVTNLETRRTLTNQGVRFNYLITIANLGTGEVVSKEKCFDDTQPLNNNVSIKVIVGTEEIECNVNSVDLINGEEKTVSCYYESDATVAYETTMKVQLNYDYSTSILRTTTLKRE